LLRNGGRKNHRQVGPIPEAARQEHPDAGRLGKGRTAGATRAWPAPGRERPVRRLGLSGVRGRPWSLAADVGASGLRLRGRRPAREATLKAGCGARVGTGTDGPSPACSGARSRRGQRLLVALCWIVDGGRSSCWSGCSPRFSGRALAVAVRVVVGVFPPSAPVFRAARPLPDAHLSRGTRAGRSGLVPREPTGQYPSGRPPPRRRVSQASSTRCAAIWMRCCRLGDRATGLLATPGPDRQVAKGVLGGVRSRARRTRCTRPDSASSSACSGSVRRDPRAEWRDPARGPSVLTC